jgi:hypothetical protein
MEGQEERKEGVGVQDPVKGRNLSEVGGDVATRDSGRLRPRAFREASDMRMAESGCLFGSRCARRGVEARSWSRCLRRGGKLHSVRRSTGLLATREGTPGSPTLRAIARYDLVMHALPSTCGL